VAPCSSGGEAVAVLLRVLQQRVLQLLLLLLRRPAS
jgi:hypothetical protein